MGTVESVFVACRGHGSLSGRDTGPSLISSGGPVFCPSVLAAGPRNQEALAVTGM